MPNVHFYVGISAGKVGLEIGYLFLFDIYFNFTSSPPLDFPWALYGWVRGGWDRWDKWERWVVFT